MNWVKRGSKVKKSLGMGHLVRTGRGEGAVFRGPRVGQETGYDSKK